MAKIAHKEFSPYNLEIKKELILNRNVQNVF